MLLAALPAHLFVELKAGIPVPMVMSWFVSNSVDSLIGAGLIRWLSPGPARFDSFRRYSALVLATLVAVGLSSFLDAWFVQLNGWGTVGYWDNWRLRFFSNVLATLTLVPVIVGLAAGAVETPRIAPTRRLLEATLLAAILLAVSYFVFSRPAGPNTVPALLYAPLPFLLWAAVRFGPTTTSGFLLGVSLLAIDSAIAGDGPFVASTPAENAFSMQLFLIVIAVPLTALSAVTRERLTAPGGASAEPEAAPAGTGRRADGHLGVADRHRPLAPVRQDEGDLRSRPGPPGPHARPISPASSTRTIESTWPRRCNAPCGRARRTRRSSGSPSRTGRLRWVHAKGVALFDETGRPVRLLGVSADVTERKLTYAAVSEWKSRYEAAVQASNQLLYDWDPHTNDVTYGGDVERILGYSREEMQGGLQAFVDKIHPEDREAFEREIARVLDTEDSFRLTYRMHRKDGRVIWLRGSGLLLPRR